MLTTLKFTVSGLSLLGLSLLWFALFRVAWYRSSQSNPIDGASPVLLAVALVITIRSIASCLTATRSKAVN